MTAKIISIRDDNDSIHPYPVDELVNDHYLYSPTIIKDGGVYREHDIDYWEKNSKNNSSVKKTVLAPEHCDLEELWDDYIVPGLSTHLYGLSNDSPPSVRKGFRGAQHYKIRIFWKGNSDIRYYTFEKKNGDWIATPSKNAF